MHRGKVLYEGMLVGLTGAIVVAVWFFIFDLAEGTPFRTPALLGAALFEGLRDTAALMVTPALVLKYSVVHGQGVADIGRVIPAGCGRSAWFSRTRTSRPWTPIGGRRTTWPSARSIFRI